MPQSSWTRVLIPGERQVEARLYQFQKQASLALRGSNLQMLTGILPELRLQKPVFQEEMTA